MKIISSKNDIIKANAIYSKLQQLHDLKELTPDIVYGCAVYIYPYMFEISSNEPNINNTWAYQFSWNTIEEICSDIMETLEECWNAKEHSEIFISKQFTI